MHHAERLRSAAGTLRAHASSLGFPNELMLWFLLFGTIGYLIYRLCRKRRFRSIQAQISRYKDVSYAKLPAPEKRKLRSLVEAALNSDVDLEETASKVVGELYMEIEKEDFYNQGGLGLSELSSRRRRQQ